MKLLLDQGVARTAAEELRLLGFDVVHTAEIGMSRAQDDEILARALQEGRIIVTLDADFHALLVLGKAVAPSVIRLRDERLDGPTVASMVQAVVATCEPALLQGAMVSTGAPRSPRLRLPSFALSTVQHSGRPLTPRAIVLGDRRHRRSPRSAAHFNQRLAIRQTRLDVWPSSLQDPLKQGVRGVSAGKPDDAGWRAKPMQQMNEVDVLRHHDGIRGSCRFEDGNVIGVSEPQIANSDRVDTQLITHPSCQTRRQLGIEPDRRSHAASTAWSTQRDAYISEARTSSSVRSGSSATTCSALRPPDRRSKTSDTRMRIPRMHGRPPHCVDRMVMRSSNMSIMRTSRHRPPHGITRWPGINPTVREAGYRSAGTVRHGETAITWDTHLGGHAVTLIGIERADRCVASETGPQKDSILPVGVAGGLLIGGETWLLAGLEQGVRMCRTIARSMSLDGSRPARPDM